MKFTGKIEVTTKYGRNEIIVNCTVLHEGVEYFKGGFILANTPARMKLAKRLKAAMDAGVVYTDCKVTPLAPPLVGNFMASTPAVLGRTMNADLVKLGF